MKPYGVRHWPEYEPALQKRGKRTLWLSAETTVSWQALTSGNTGGQRATSALAIETDLTVRCVYHLGLRQTQGFLAWSSVLSPPGRPPRCELRIRQRFWEINDLARLSQLTPGPH